MLHTLNDMIGTTIRATDGSLGPVHDFYFDDSTWTIRYMVADTDAALSGRKVLIGLVALGTPDWQSETFSVNLTCEQVRTSPAVDTEKPVFRQHEIDLHLHYSWPAYWDAGYGGTFGITPYPLFEKPLEEQEPSSSANEENPHLRSTRQITGYHIHATDGVIGHCTDFIVDEETWEIAYLVIETGNWFMGEKVLVAVKWINNIQWSDDCIYVNLSRTMVKSSPEFDPSKTVLRTYSKDVYDNG